MIGGRKRQLHLMCMAAKKFGRIYPLHGKVWSECFELDEDLESLIFWCLDQDRTARTVRELQPQN